MLTFLLSARVRIWPMRALCLALCLAGACADDSGHGPGAVGDTGVPAPVGDTGVPAAGDAGMSTGPCGGKPGRLRGKSKQTVTAGGATRDFILYAPSSLAASTPAPVVLITHGFTMNADQMFEITKYAELADKEKFVALFLNGQSGFGPWNVGSPDCSSTLGILPIGSGDDQAFVDEALKLVEQDQCLDREHVFMTGFSMGGYLANETGCLRNEIRAVAPHSGGTHDLASCVTKHKPVLVMHFQGDGLIPYNCGAQARDRWVMRNGCQKEAPEVRTVNGGSCEYYAGCPADGQVAFCSFTIPTTGTRNESYPGHAWSGGSKEGPANGAGFAIPETASATELSWGFFKMYAW